MDVINYSKIKKVEDDLVAHKEDNMPHQITNLQTGKIYKYGFQLSTEGDPQIIYREG